MAKTPLSVTIVKGKVDNTDPAVVAARKALADARKASADKANDKVNAKLAKMSFVFTNEAGVSLTMTALEVRNEIEALRSLASSWRVVEDNEANRKAFAKNLDAKVKRYEKNPEKFVLGDPSRKQFSVFVGGAAKAAHEAGMSHAEIVAQFVFVQRMIANKQAILDWMIAQAKASLGSKKQAVKA